MNHQKPRSLRMLHRFSLLLIVLAAPPVLYAQASKITSTEGGYSATFPAAATRETEPPKTVNGLTYSVETYTATLQGQMFVTVYTSYQGGTVNTEKELQANVDNFVKGVGATGTATKSIQYSSPWNTIPGIEFTCETDQITFHGKFFVGGNDVWGIVYGARKGSESDATKQEFFRSLEINRSPKKGDHG
jgi:hypothetical protein